MKNNLMQLANPCILDISPYQPGKPISECQREYGLLNFAKLASNENPLGPSTNVQAAIQAAIPTLSAYPDCNGYSLRTKIAEKFQVGYDNILIGNGSEELLALLLHVFIEPGQEVIFGQYSFMGYEGLSKSAGAKVVTVKMPSWHIDLDAVLAAVTAKTKIILLDNPNNPTGTYFNASSFKNFLGQLDPNIIVICDEAYYDYIQKPDYPQTHEWIVKHPNVIVTRTFSKAYGLAGLRVGYIIANEVVIDLINRVRQPFNVNTLGQIAATAALDDDGYLAHSIKMNEIQRNYIYSGLEKIGLDFLPSEANFLMIHVKEDGFSVYEALLRKGVIIRPLRYYGINDYIRVSVGSRKDNNIFLQALEFILTKEKVA